MRLRLKEAVERILAHIKPPLEAEYVPLTEAWQRCAGEIITAPHPYPTFRRSGMDGYAVRAADLPTTGDNTATIELHVLESLPAGTVPTRALEPGQAARIMTGGMLPEGADTVVMLEMTTAIERGGASYVRISKSVPAGRNVADRQRTASGRSVSKLDAASVQAKRPCWLRSVMEAFPSCDGLALACSPLAASCWTLKSR